MFFASNYFYAYQGAITTFLFNGRTRALVATLTGLGSILGSIFVDMILDRLPYSRRTRSMVGCGVVALLNTAVWVGGLVFQVQFSRDTDHDPWDWTQGAAIGPIILLMSCEFNVLRRITVDGIRLHFGRFISGTRVLHHVGHVQRSLQARSNGGLL